jgi:MFS family permease
MIVARYGASGVLLIITGYSSVSVRSRPTPRRSRGQSSFLLSSSFANPAYLIVSEIFPLEIRSLAIAFFYACGTLAGGVAAPVLFGRLIATPQRMNVLYGYLLAGTLMLGAAFVEVRIGISAERRSLEGVSVPLSAAD